MPVETQIRAAESDGVVQRTRIFNKRMIPPGNYDCFNKRIAELEVAQRLLQLRCAAVPSDDPHADWMHKCADAVTAIDVSHIPFHLRSHLQKFDDQRLAVLPFPAQPKTPITKWCEKPRYKKIPRHLWPKKYQDFWVKEHWPKVLKALKKILRGIKEGIYVPDKFAFDEAWYNPNLTGTPWTFTKDPDTPWRPVDVNAQPRGSVLVDLLASDMGEQFNNQRLRSFLVQGICLGCQDMPLRTKDMKQICAPL